MHREQKLCAQGSEVSTVLSKHIKHSSVSSPPYVLTHFITVETVKGFSMSNIFSSHVVVVVVVADVVEVEGPSSSSNKLPAAVVWHG